MSDKRLHRGAHPEDAAAFGPDAIPRLRTATGELSWLLSRGYAEKSATKLVGDRHSLVERQRIAARRCACSDAARVDRRARVVPAESVKGRRILLDGFNVLTTIEAALSRGVILVGRDGCYRDMASMHGSFQKVTETPRALELIGNHLAGLGVASAEWYLDQPVSNSGRLKQAMTALAEERGWAWHIELVPDPDALLARTDEVVVSADSGILDRCAVWLNLAAEVIERRVPGAWRVVLDPDLPEPAPSAPPLST